MLQLITKKKYFYCFYKFNILIFCPLSSEILDVEVNPEKNIFLLFL